MRPLTWLIKGDERYGVGTTAVALAAEMRRRGWPVHTLAYLDGHAAEQMRAADVEVHLLQAEPGIGSYRGSPLGKLVQYLRGRRADHVFAAHVADALRSYGGRHLHVLWPQHVFPAIGATIAVGGACYWEMPNYVSPRAAPLYRRAIRRGDVTVLANSAATGRTVAGRGVEPVTFYAATQSRRFFPDSPEVVEAGREVRASLGLADVDPLFVVAGRLGVDKGGGDLLDAILHLPPDDRPHLALVGDPRPGDDFADTLRRRASAAGYGRLHLVGHRDDVRPWYAAADVTANLRRTPEPFGLSVIESMLMKTPVLVNPLGGPAETVLDGESGWHAGDDLNADLRRVLADRSRWPEMGEAGRRRSLDLFSDVALANHYERLLAGSSSRSA